MKIYYVRHGQSQANLDRVYAGSLLDSPLTDKGCQQAQAAALELIQLEDRVDVIVSSPLARAHETAKIIAKESKLSIETDGGFEEWSFGSATGMPNDTYTPDEVMKVEGAEPATEFQARIVAALRKVADRDETVLIVAHGAVMAMIEATYQGLEPEKYREVEEIPNAKIIDITDKVQKICDKPEI